MTALDDIRRTTIAMEAHLPLDRIELMKKAREEGATWDQVAEAAFMTKDGASYLVKNGIKNRTTDFLGLSTGKSKSKKVAGDETPAAE